LFIGFVILFTILSTLFLKELYILVNLDKIVLFISSTKFVA
jgi:hypothetical protein